MNGMVRGSRPTLRHFIQETSQNEIKNAFQLQNFLYESQETILFSTWFEIQNRFDACSFVRCPYSFVSKYLGWTTCSVFLLLTEREKKSCLRKLINDVQKKIWKRNKWTSACQARINLVPKKNLLVTLNTFYLRCWWLLVTIIRYLKLESWAFWSWKCRRKISVIK